MCNEDQNCGKRRGFGFMRSAWLLWMTASVGCSSSFSESGSKSAHPQTTIANPRSNSAGTYSVTADAIAIQETENSPKEPCSGSATSEIDVNDPWAPYSDGISWQFRYQFRENLTDYFYLKADSSDFLDNGEIRPQEFFNSRVEGWGPESIALLQNSQLIECLRVDEPVGVAEIEVVYSISNLKCLIISTDSEEKWDLKRFNRFSELRHLTLHLELKREVSPGVLECLDLSKLESLDLSSGSGAIGDAGVLELHASKRLIRLGLRANRVTSTGLVRIVEAFPNLQSLDICRNSEIGPEAVATLSRLPYLRRLYCSNTELGKSLANSESSTSREFKRRLPNCMILLQR